MASKAWTARRSRDAGEDGRETAAGGAEIRRLALVEARRDELCDGVVHIGAQVELERLLDAVDEDGALARRHQALRDVRPREDLRPRAARELVAAVDGLAA